MSKWYVWEWDSHEMGSGDVTFDYVKRWRRGWVTLYKFVTDYERDEQVEWRLFLPFNFNVGIEYSRVKQ